MKRFFLRIVRLFLGARCPMLAAGLTYYTMLALVPAVCISLVVAKMFGADDFARRKVREHVSAAIERIEMAQDDPLAAVTSDELAREEKRAAAKELAAQARAIEAQVFDTVEKIDFKALGLVGILALAWTVIGAIGMVETSFNAIWGVEKPRSFVKSKALDAFMALALPVLCALAAAGPVLKLVRDAIAAATGGVPIAGRAGELAIALIDFWPLRTCASLALAALALALVYATLPARRTGRKNAFLAALAAAALSGAWLKICAVAQVGMSKTSALYGSLAFLPIMLAWIYMAWQILLLGCCMHRALDE